jgi:hypothetical protein
MTITAAIHATATLSGHELALQRRLAMARHGKAAIVNSAALRGAARTVASPAVAPAAERPAQGIRECTAAAPAVDRTATTAAQTAPTAAASGRLVAMQRRRALSLTGRAGCSTSAAARPDRRVKARDAKPAPARVEQGHAPSGQTITGTTVERSPKVTGNEAGSCRPVTGTQYAGAEQFDTFCSARLQPGPETVAGAQGEKSAAAGDSTADPAGASGDRGELHGAPQKVGITHTAMGNVVTGTVVGRSPRATGDEAGTCKPVTGTEYLAAEQFRDWCRAKPPAKPHKVSVMSSRSGQTVSGTPVDRSAKVTGNEVGSCRAVTGSQYYNSVDFADLCQANGPRKVGQMQTLGGRTVTGSEVAPSPKLTGDESFQCHAVTGTDYISPRQLEAVCLPGKVPDTQPVSKVAVDSTLRGQPITGSAVGRAAKVTGDEAGACTPVSGTPYVGQGQYAGFCPPSSVEAQSARVRDSAVIPATAVTGDRPGAGGSRVTGDERGACKAVSGTPYLGADNIPPRCTGSGRFVARAGAAEKPPRPPPPKSFSIVSPAHQARERCGYAVTGSSTSTERITGPVNKADGLITGTPEFRHGEESRRQGESPQRPAAALRLSGEGSQQGRQVSGDAWDSAVRVTGTEGASSAARNPTMRGQTRGAGVDALKFREIQRPAVPDSNVTGSAGNTRKGATVTVSGGARG